MDEKLYEQLFKLAEVLHWLGKGTEANALILLARLLKHKKIEKLEELEGYVVSVEMS